MSDASLHELLSAWLDGQLTGSDKARAERLVSEDPLCADLVRQWKSQREQIRALPIYRLDSDFSERVLAKASLTAEADSVSRADPTADIQPAAQESTSYFASRSALTAITALAAMLLLTLFTLPMRIPPPKVAFETARPDAADKKTDDAQPIPMKSGVSELANIDAPAVSGRNTKEAVNGESAVERDDESELEMFSMQGIVDNEGGVGGGGGGFIPEPAKSSNEIVQHYEPDAQFGFGSESASKQQLRSQTRSRQTADSPAPKLEGHSEKLSDLGLQPSDEFVPAQVAGRMTANEAVQGGAQQPSQSPLEASGDAAKDKAVREISPALQLAENSVDEVWMIEIAEVPSLQKLEQAMRQNDIAFKKSPAQFGQQSAGPVLSDLDANVQAVYVITSPTQLRGAIRNLSGNAEITVFPLPTNPPNGQASGIAGQAGARPNQPVDQARLGQVLKENKSLGGFANSFAQQLPSNFRMKAGLEPAEKLRLLKLAESRERSASKAAPTPIASAGKANPAANPANNLPAAAEFPAPASQTVESQLQTRPIADPADADHTTARRSAGQIPDQERKAETSPLNRDESDTSVATQSGLKSELGRRYLLLFRFDSATAPPKEIALPAGPGK